MAEEYSVEEVYMKRLGTPVVSPHVPTEIVLPLYILERLVTLSGEAVTRIRDIEYFAWSSCARASCVILD